MTNNYIFWQALLDNLGVTGKDKPRFRSTETIKQTATKMPRTDRHHTSGKRSQKRQEKNALPVHSLSSKWTASQNVQKVLCKLQYFSTFIQAFEDTSMMQKEKFITSLLIIPEFSPPDSISMTYEQIQMGRIQ